MASSTLPSDAPVAGRVFPKRALTLCATALAAWGLCAGYTLQLNPEVLHYAYGATVKDTWAERMTREQGTKIVVVGASSCEFAFDGEQMLRDHGMALVNDGWQAGMGAAVITESGLDHLRPADTLVVALEPFMLTGPLDQPALGVQLSVASGHPHWVDRPALGVGQVGWFQKAAAMRPGAYHTFTLLGKLVRGDALYRYRNDDYHPSGWKQTPVRLPFDGPAEHERTLSADAQTLLANLRAWSDAHDVRVVYSLPWSWTPEAEVVRYQQDNLAFLQQVSNYLPILRDERLGADPIRDHYSDTALHLNETGAALRTQELAAQLVRWDVWLPGELEARHTR